MTILVYVNSDEIQRPDVIRKGFATQDVILPCSGEVLAGEGNVHPFAIAHILAQAEHLPNECMQGQSDCDNCPVYDWRRSE